LHPATADFAPNHGGCHHFALALFKQQDRHAFANVVAGHVAEDTGAFSVQRQVHGGFLRLAVEASLGVGQVFAGQHHLAFCDDGAACAVQVALRAKGHGTTAGFGCPAFAAFVHHAQFQRGRAAQDVFGLGRVLHARQLHHDAVCTLLLDDGFGHAEFVDAVVQRGDVLFQRLVLHPAGRFGLDGERQAHIGPVGGLGHQQVCKLVLQDVFRLLGCCRVAQLQLQCLTVALDSAVAYALFAQRHPHVACKHLGFFGECALHVHLKQEVHTTSKVQAQVHRVGVKGLQPGWGAGQQVQRHRVCGVGGVGVEGLFQCITGLELRVGIVESGFDRVAVHLNQRRFDTLGFQNLLYFCECGSVHFQRGLGR